MRGANSFSRNILVVGSTGVGKSSLINYLIGKAASEVDVGHPVAERDELPCYSCNSAGETLAFFETWGIEIEFEGVVRCKRLFAKIFADAKFDSVVYCICAPGMRVTDQDLEMINFFKDKGLDVVVAFTKCDLVPDSDCAIMEKVLPKGIKCVETSAGATTRVGKIDPFGREEILHALVGNGIEMSGEKSFPCNILVVGATGVGKSSLVNYLIGRSVAKVGVGTPVTGRDDIHRYSCKFAGVNLALFDTWGIEVDKTEDWQRRVKKIIGTDGEDGVAWFHTVVYCISAGGDRVQPHDLKMLKFFKDEGYSLVVAFTKCDQVPKSKSDILEATLPSSYQYVEICSGGTIRDRKTEPFGKEDLLRVLVKVASTNLHRRLERFGHKLVSDWETNMLDRLVYRDVGRLFNSKHEDWIKEEANTFANKLSNQMAEFINLQSGINNRLSMAKELSNSSMPLDVRPPESPPLTALDVVGMIALSWAFVPFLIIRTAIYGEEDERDKLKKMIASAAKQMNEAVDKVAENIRHSVEV